MSYILDALRRADAERDRGTVPTLYARHEPTPPEDDDARRRPWLAITGVAALLAAGGVAAWLLWGGEPEPPRATTVAVGSAPVPTPVVPGVVPVGPPAATVPSAVAPAAVTVAPTPQPPVVTAAATPPRVANAVRPAPPPTPAASRPARVPPAATTSPNPGAADDRNRVYAMTELPDAVKRDLPKIAISGGSWSRDKASRMVMVNGQVLHEGDTVAPGLVLESIRLKSAVLAWKGYRYELTY